jgi:hypothetical protein
VKALAPTIASITSLLLMLATLPRLAAQDARTALLDADRRAAQLSSDSGYPASLREVLHPTGILLWPGAPVVIGADHLERFLQLSPNGDSPRLTWQPLGLELARDSTLGVTWGVAVSTTPIASDPPRLGRYISAWRRDRERWTIAVLLVMGIEPSSSLDRFTVLPTHGRLAEPSGASAPFIAADQVFARLARDSGAAIAFRTWAAPDAVSFGGGSLLVRGPEAIGRAVAGPQRWRWHPVAAGAARSGDLGWTVGEAVIARGDETSYSKYLTIWSRARDGSIRFLLDGGNARPAGGKP